MIKFNIIGTVSSTMIISPYPCARNYQTIHVYLISTLALQQTTMNFKCIRKCPIRSSGRGKKIYRS